jgi:nitrite reductase/ring-hydroxylating ferredoxin subunit/uncharacterized membrane protein
MKKMQDVTSRISDRLERSDWLDGPADKLQALLGRVGLAGRSRSLLSGTWLGHPVHPFLVATPIGCWTSAMVLDAVGQRQAARTVIGAGVVSVVPTAITGLSDWADTAGAERRVGLVHLAANTVATACYAVSYLQRRRDARAGVLLAAVGAGVASAGGWLGGHLAYAMGVGVDTNAFDGASTGWTRLAVDVHGDGLVRAEVGPTALVAARHDGAVRVLADRCSHRGASLAEGELEDGCVTCPWHGSRFDVVTGHVVRGPAVVAQPAYEVRETAGGVEVSRSEPRALRSNSTHP